MQLQQQQTICNYDDIVNIMLNEQSTLDTYKLTNSTWVAENPKYSDKPANDFLGLIHNRVDKDLLELIESDVSFNRLITNAKEHETGSFEVEDIKYLFLRAGSNESILIDRNGVTHFILDDLLLTQF